MNSNISIAPFTLSLFGEDGGDAGAQGVTETAAMSQTAVEANVADSQEQQVDRSSEFEKLIKGEYKDEYGKRVEDTVQKRLKSSKETVEKFEALTPVLELLGSKYGADYNDIEALKNAILEDDSYYEEEALEKGLTVEQLKEIKKMEHENAALRAQMEEQKAQEESERIIGEWIEQEKQIKEIYPSFDLQTELNDSRIMDLLRSNVDLKTAYEVVHLNELQALGAKAVADKTLQQVTNNIIANGARPTENGLSSQSAAITSIDPSKMTKAERAALNARAASGERISF